MWLKQQIGQRRIRHGELVAWRHMLAILHESGLDSSAVLHYWGARACRVAFPRCMYRRLAHATTE